MSPRTEKQFEAIREEKIHLIMGTALKLFATDGYGNTSIRQIAKQAKISKGLLYNYFSSKEELLQAILNSGIDELMEVFDPNKDGVLEVTEMIFFINETFRMLQIHEEFWRLYFSVSLQPAVYKYVRQRIEEIYKPFTEMMVDYFTKLGYESPRMEAVIFGSLLDGITMNYLINPDTLPLETLKNELILRYCSQTGTSKEQ